jgi:hypothetical protein
MTVSLDASLYPPQFRDHITPPIRKLFLELEDPTPNSSTDPERRNSARLSAENAILRSHCESWRKRAEAHGAATLGLVGLARTARSHALQMRHERDALQEKYSALKRKIEEPEYVNRFFSIHGLFSNVSQIFNSVSPLFFPLYQKPSNR